MRGAPTYLRAVVTTACNYRCSYCHGEGVTDRSRPVATDLLAGCLQAVCRAGVRKVKLLGGEPFLCRDLEHLVRAIRTARPDADISVITGGVAPVERLDRAYAAGLDRVNVTIHGFCEAAFAERRNRTPHAYELRRRFIEAVLAAGRPLKLNYVYTGPGAEPDLGQLLAFAAGRGLLVNVLDDLSQNLSHCDVEAAVRRLRGEPDRIDIDCDPHSLPTARWLYADGLQVEIKTSSLGNEAPFAACSGCPHRGARCREGIYAGRLTPDGRLQACMDRPDLSADLAGAVRDGGVEAGTRRWRAFFGGLCHEAA